MDDAFGVRVSRLGALSDPIRRSLYRFVSASPEAVTRDQAAAGVKVAKHTARFHLERLVEEGLLVTEFRRLTGRTGPGAGRPSKLYRRAHRELTVSVPSRRYDLAGQVLADAVERTLGGTPIEDAVEQAADNAARIVVEAWPQGGPELTQVAGILDELGYEPSVTDAGLTLGNCPFDRLAADHRDLVCGLNLMFVASVGERVGCGEDAEPVEPGRGCCVRFSRP